MLRADALYTRIDDIEQIVTYNSQLLLGLILPLLLIAVGLIEHGKRSGVTVM